MWLDQLQGVENYYCSRGNISFALSNYSDQSIDPSKRNCMKFQTFLGREAESISSAYIQLICPLDLYSQNWGSQVRTRVSGCVHACLPCIQPTYNMLELNILFVNWLNLIGLFLLRESILDLYPHNKSLGRWLSFLQALSCTL